MSKIYFKKTVSNKIFISDNKEKYEIEHPYFSFNTNEVPYDSSIFKSCLETKQIVVVGIDKDFISIWDFTRYLEKDEIVEEQKKIDVKIEKVKEKKREKRVKEEQIQEQKELKIKEEQIKKKREEENNFDIISDSEILSKL